MNLFLTMMVSFCNLIGSAVNDAPVYLAALTQPATSVAQAADPITIEAPLEQQTGTAVAVAAPVTGEEPAGTWSIAGEVSVGEYVLPYSISGYFKANEAKPVLTKVSVGSEGLGLSFEIPTVIKEAVEQYDEYLNSVLELVTQFRLQGVGLKFCIDALCVTAEVSAEGSLFDRHYGIVTTEPFLPPVP